MPDDLLVTCENVSKKFCRSLKRSLWYGVKDICSELNPFRGEQDIVGTAHLPALRKDEFWAVDDISFELKRGECLGLIGHNGAGKSTLLKMLNGLIKPDHGRIKMKGRIGALIELNAGFNPILTGRENVYIYGSILGFSKKEIDQKYDAIVDFSEMDEFMEMPVRSYSSGMRVRLGFSVAAQMEPDVLIIDEVLAVGDVGFQIKCLNRIHELLGRAAVIFVSHSMPAVARISTQAMVMHNGKTLCHASDVNQGIDAYHRGFKTDLQKQIITSGHQIEDISINGNPYTSPPLINFGESLLLEIGLETPYECKKIGIKIFVINQSQHPVVSFVTDNYHYFFWENTSNTITLKICIQELRLSSGWHNVNIVLFDHTTNIVINRIDNVISFIMGQHISSGCNSFQAVEWSVNKNSYN